MTNKKHITILVTTLALICLGILIFSYKDKSKDAEKKKRKIATSTIFSSQAQNQPTETIPSSVGVTSQRKPLANEVQYKNIQYKFARIYQKSLKVEELKEGGGASTIVFQNPEEGLGFQIFIVPFSGNQITDERFKQDVPSGVRDELRNISVDGASGASFYSTNTLLGETAEVWFIKNGFLYEVTAPKSLVSWLSTIMETWFFI